MISPLCPADPEVLDPPVSKVADNGEATPASRPDGSPLFTLVVLAAVFATPLLLALRPAAPPLKDADVWWHLRVGQWVVQHQGVPDADPFASGHKPWVAYSWLFEALLFGLYQVFGLGGILIYRAAMTLAVVAVLFLFVRRYQPHFILAAALTGAATIALSPLVSERPWLFTVLFSTLTAWAVLELRSGRASRWVWLLPLAYVVWANTHIQFVYGLFVLGLGCAAPVLDRLLRRSPADGSEDTAAVFGSRGWYVLLLLTAACAAATLVNPYYARLYVVVWEYATQPGPFRHVQELQALEFRDAPDWTLLVLAAAAVFTLGRQRRTDTFAALFLAAAAVLAFRSRRDVWVLTLASVVVLAPGLHVRTEGSLRPRVSWRSGAALVGILGLLAAVVVFGRGYHRGRLQEEVAATFPARAAEFVAEKGYPGPLFNDFNWGGYLIWGLPDLPVALDGRTNLHGDERILSIEKCWFGSPGWKDNPDLAAANVVIADVQTPLASLLLGDERFTRVYDDDVARVFVRAPQPSKGPASGSAGQPASR
jgi:hypothetical protein